MVSSADVLKQLASSWDMGNWLLHVYIRTRHSTDGVGRKPLTKLCSACDLCCKGHVRCTRDEPCKKYKVSGGCCQYSLSLHSGNLRAMGTRDVSGRQLSTGLTPESSTNSSEAIIIGKASVDGSLIWHLSIPDFFAIDTDSFDISNVLVSYLSWCPRNYISKVVFCCRETFLRGKLLVRCWHLGQCWRYLVQKPPWSGNWPLVNNF